MDIKILGSGCAKCKELEKNTREAVKNMKLDASIEKVQDFEEIMTYDIMTTPALVVNEKVICSGKLLKTKEIELLLSKDS